MTFINRLFSRAPILTLALTAGLVGAACHRNQPGDDFDGGTGDGGDPFGDGGIMACATQSAKAELAPLDILLILDTSASMDYGGKWTSVKAAVRSFVKNPAANGLGLGVQYYPLRAQCNRVDYGMPAVPIQVLPAGQMDISDSLGLQQMSGGTPMVPAMEGVSAYLKQWATDHPTHKIVIVLASDGAPDDSCIAPSADGRVNSLANATLTAMEAFQSSAKISTFVIGVGSETAVLEQIATAGGGKALFVDTTSDIQGAFLNALTQIRGNALSCEFAIPNAGDMVLDYERVNVLFTPSDMASPTTFVYVGSVDMCGSAPGNGWYYDDPKMPKKVVLCQDACSTATSASMGRVDVVFGCKTNIL